MVAVTVGLKVKGKALAPKPPVVLGDDHMKRIGETIAAPLRATLAAGLDADGNPLPPEVSSGDGIPGHETGALAASIKARRTKRGRLVVMPDYKKFRYGIFLAGGVQVRGQVARPFLGMSRSTLDQVAGANVERFQKWVDGALSTAGASRVGFNGSRGAL